MSETQSITIEEYVHHSQVLSAGISRNELNECTFVTLVRTNQMIPMIMQELEQFSRASIKKLKLDMALKQNVLVIQAPAYSGSALVEYAETIRPYDTFMLIKKLLADLTEYETLPKSIYLQVLNQDKYIVDSNGMPRIQFWIDDLTVFQKENAVNMDELVYQKLSHLLRATFSTDFVPKQLSAFVNEIESGKYKTCLEMLYALENALSAYLETDSERRGESFVKKAWTFLQKHMLAIVILLLVIAYALYWFYFSTPAPSETIYKSKIGDVQFVADKSSTASDKGTQTYVLIFPKEEVPVITEPDDSTEMEPQDPLESEPEPSQTIIIQPGDNLIRICRRYYGDGQYYIELAQYNNITNPNLIPIGMALEIPPLEQLIAQ